LEGAIKKQEILLLVTAEAGTKISELLIDRAGTTGARIQLFVKH
jgi:hypothetical protein